MMLSLLLGVSVRSWSADGTTGISSQVEAMRKDVEQLRLQLQRDLEVAGRQSDTAGIAAAQQTYYQGMQELMQKYLPHRSQTPTEEKRP